MNSTPDWLNRETILLGTAGVEKLQASHVLLAGCGGVGSYTAEALVRAGIGELTVFDPDKVHITNLNRQLPALTSTINEYKVQVLAQRLLDINPQLKLHVFAEALTMENIPQILDETRFDHIADAIDSVNEKCLLLAAAIQRNIRCIASMGAGFRLDPSQIQYADISKTYNCKLARMIRGKLKKIYGITKGIDCVFSSEIPCPPAATDPDNTIGSSSFIPGIFGLFMAGRIINQLALPSSE
ncbi:MAG: tRNA threonylcarbamoyladenosine dehydratase [Lentisphaerae bacterium]|nr:tRNA threonylcarbamoyladenosine dehydratase [Lentisphaerota bacterium]